MGQSSIYLIVLPLAIAALACAAAIYAWRQYRAAFSRWRQQLQSFIRLQARLDSLESLLDSDSGTIFLWDGYGVLRIYADAAGAYTGEDAFEAFRAELTPASQAELQDAVQALRASGASFAFPLFCQDGRTLASRGKPAMAGSAVIISDVSDAFKEICCLRDALADTAEERDFLRHAINNIPYPSWRLDSQGQLNWVNEAYCRAIDAPSIESAVSRGEELIDRRALDDAGGRGQLHRLRTVIDGQRRILDVYELDAINGDGGVGIAVDVTEIDDANNKVLKLLEEQRSWLDLLSKPVAIFSADRTLEFFNQAFADLWNLPSGWMANRPDHGEVLEAMRESRRLPEQADFPAWKKKQLASYTNLIESQEEIWQLPNERTLRVVTQARPHGGLFILYEDLTELLTLERSLNALSKVQRETLNSLREGVAVFGVDGRMNLYNPAFLRIWKTDAAMLADRPHIEDLLPLYTAFAPDLRGWDQILAWVTGADSSREMHRTRFQRKDNSVVECMVVPLPDGGSLLSFSDITDSAQIERALRERNDALETTDRLKSEFITHISYQFRTPLNSIIGFAEILEHEFFGGLNERQHEYSQGLLEASQHLLTLVNDVIDLATIEAGHMSLALGEVDVYGLLLSIRELSRQNARESDITLTLDCPPGIGAIHADARRVKQVMFNLISNAIRFSSAGEEIVIGANRKIGADGRELCQLWVRDKGVGVDPSYQSNMFNSFESRSVRGKEQGAGIGLSLVRSLVELHDGWVDVESVPGRGAKVTCNLPQNEAATGNAAPVTQPLETQAIRARP